MNEEALQYSFELFTKDGYEGTIEEYKELLKTNQEALDYSYDLFSKDGYDGEKQEYNKLIGAVQEDTQDFPTAVATETAPVTADATAEDTELAPVDTSLESQSNAPFVINGQPATEQEFNAYKKDLAERDVLEKDESFFSATGFVDFFSDIATAAEEGWRQGELIDPAFELYSLGDKSTDQDVLNFVNKNKEVARKNLGSAEMREFNKTYEEEGGGFWGFIKGVVENPSTLSTMLVSSISSQISSLRSDEVRAAGAAAAATGAVAGSAIPVPGVSTLGGAIAGAMGGTMGAMETGLTFAELLQEEAGGLDPDKIKKILQDPEKLADLKNRALNRGVAIAAVEMATLGIAKGVGGKLATAGFKRAPMVAAGVTGAVEIAGGGLGEVAGRYVAGQEMDAAEIGFEAFAGLGSAPLTLGKQALNIQTNLDRVKINKEVNRTEYGNIVDVFKPETKTDGAEIKISKIKNSRKILDEKVDAQVKRAEITKEQGDAIKNNFRKTQGTVNQVKSLNLSENTEVEVVELQKEKLKLQAQIKEVNDKALTGTQLERVEAINKEQQSAIKEGRFTSRTKAATELATGLEFKEEPKVFNTTEEYIKAIAKEEGMSDKQASKAAKNSNGVFLGKGKIFIDKKVALEQGAVSVANHEVLHPILNAVIGDINKQRAILDDFKSKLNKSQIDWVQGQLDANVELANHDSEFLTYFSEGILNEQIKYDETVFTKLKEVVSKVFRKLGYNNIKFESGKDVYNFLKEYNNSILKNDKIQSSQVLKAIKNRETEKGVKVSEVEVVNRMQLSKTSQEQVDTLQEELDNLDEYDFTDEIEYDQAVANLENKIRTVKRKETLAKREVKKEVKEKVVADKKIFDNEGLVETIKSKETTRKEKSNAETELLESFDALALKAIKYDTRKGDYDRTEIRDYLRQFLPGIIDRYDPSESKFSTYVTNTMAPKAQQTYERFRKIADRSLDVTAGELGSVKETAAEQSTSTQETVKKPSRKIKPIELIRNLGLQKKYKDAVKKIVEGGKALVDGNTFGNLKDLAAEVTAEIFDIPLLKVTDPADNLAFKDVIVDASNISKIKVYYPDAKVGMVIKSESSKIQDIIKSMGPDLFKLLPPENVAPELATVDAQAYRGVKGTGLKIPSSLMKAFYEATGKRSKGVTSQVAIKKLKPGLTYEQFLKELGIVKGQPNTYDRAIGQRLKAITTLFGKLATNTEVRQLEGVTDVQAQNIAAGKSDIQFSKSISSDEKTSIKNVLNSEISNTTSDISLDADVLKRINSKISEVKNIRELFEVITSETSKILGVKSQRNLDIKILQNLIAYSKNKNSKEIIDSFKEYRKLFKYEYKVIGYDFAVDKLKKSLKLSSSIEAKIKIIKDFLKFESRSIRTGQINGIKTNKTLFDKILKDTGAEKLGFGVEQVKNKSYITFKKNKTSKPVRLKGMLDITEIKKGFTSSTIETIKQESTAALDYIINILKNTDIENAKGFLALSSIDQRGILRKLSTPGFEITGLKKNDIVLEHETTVLSIHNKLVDFVDGKISEEKLREFISESKVNLISIKLDKILNSKEVVTTDKARYLGKEFKKLLNKYKKANRYKNIGSEALFSKTYEQNKKDFYSVWATEAEMQAELYEAVEKARKPNNKTLPEGFRLSGDFTNQEVLDKMKELDDQQAEAGIQFSNSQNLDKDFNDIINNRTGIDPDKTSASIKALKKSTIYKKFEKALEGKKLYHGGSNIIKSPGIKSEDHLTWFYVDVAESAIVWAEGQSSARNESNKKQSLYEVDFNDIAKDHVVFPDFELIPYNIIKKAIDKVYPKGDYLPRSNDDIGPYGAIDIMKDPKAGEIIKEFLRWSLKNNSEYEYNTGDALIRKGKVSEGQAVIVLGEISKDKSKKISFSKTADADPKMNKEFNDILEKKSGIASDKEYKRIKAEVLGASKGRFSFFIPPSAEDFVGLLYATLGKNKTGDAQMAWYKKNLLNPFARAMENVSRDRNSLGRDFRALKKTLKIVPKNLKKKLPGEPFTTEQAVRVWIWNQIGKDIPGLDDADVKTLVDYVNSRPDLQSFGTEVMKLNKGTAYASPTDSWNTGTITTDLLETLNTTKRKEYLELWQQNVDIIFSEKNLNKLEAIYGKQYRKAMENILTRMKTGKNRVSGPDSLTSRVTDWLTSSVGAIMFFNTRSAVLQTLSAVNFINFGDNNILAAGKAFANQKQYWTDFKKLFNSEFLIERRDGLKMNVNESDIADIAKEKGVRGVINKLLKLGFTPTQLADSFAIASGGSTFYRNRLNALIKGGMNTQAAEKQAMSDFREIAEESQQSSRPDKISQQQAGPLGRIILAFANTPAQYARLIKKAASDLKNGRGDAKTNISKIIYYGVAQNLIFNALQNALDLMAFGEDEEEDEEKIISIGNGMADSLLRGLGVGGAIVSTVKNAGLKLARENAKKNPKYESAAQELLKISPPIASKVSKVVSGLRSYSWDKKEMKEKGWSLDNPAYLANANIISAASNIPLDRVIKKIDNITASTGANLSFMQRVALLAGWSEWQLGIDKDDKKTKSKKGRTINKRVINKRVVNKRTIN